MAWNGLKAISAKIFRCGHCGEKVSSSVGYFEQKSKQNIYICPNCNEPTYFNYQKNKQSPGTIYGDEVKSVPETIGKLYNEARHCMSVQAYTASVMASRKLLMNIAVENGAEEGLKFVGYVNYLDENHYTPPKSKEWVDLIRQKGNEANHEIKLMEREDAEELINFIEMLLKFIFEFPGKIKETQESEQP